mgnify:CR=1 FL=1
MPRRGEVVKQIGLELERLLDPLSKLESLEVGKTYKEAVGEIIEYIHICEFATSNSRGACGLKIPSERENHQLEEIWNPLGVTAVITAFNFPIAVYGMYNHIGTKSIRTKSKILFKNICFTKILSIRT